MYEPRIGDLVTAEVSLNGVATVLHVDETGLVLVRSSAGYKYGLPQKAVAPLRPDAPGQRVRHEGSPVLVLVGRVLGRPIGQVSQVIDVAWEVGYGRSFHEPHNLIRIADQAPAAPVEVEWARGSYVARYVARDVPAATPPAEAAAPGFAPGSVRWTAGPTCQHCGAGVLAGLLRDTCPRGCDLTLRAAEPEPDHVGTMGWHHASESLGAAPPPSFDSFSERVWTATGRGATAAHPTREGAIAAWREAVRAKEGSRP